MTQQDEPIQVGDGSIRPSEYLRRDNEFRYVRKNGRTLVTPKLVVNIVAAPDGQARLGVIAGKRFHRRAVERNRARRLLKEAFRLLRKGVSSPAWMVVVARRPLRGAKVQAVQQELISTWQKVGYWDAEQ